MLKILANDGLDPIATDCLSEKGHSIDKTHFDPDPLKAVITEYDVIIVRSATKLDQSILDTAAQEGSRLKLIIRAGVGLDNIDVDYAVAKGIGVRNTPNSSSTSVAELALGHMLNLARHIHLSNITIRRGEWNKKDYNGIQLYGRTLGIIGFGRIGQEIAYKASSLGMNILYYQRSGPKPGQEDFKYVNLDTLLKESDFITLHTPANPDGRAILDAETIKKIKKGAYVINTARGSLIDYDALIDALDSGQLSGAGLDVYTEEPPLNPRLTQHPKISMTPHIGASTEEAQRGIGAEVCDVITQFFTP